jgi:hypothetical protein
MTILAAKGKYRFCQYESGLFTVDTITKSVGRTIKASFDRAEIENYFNGLGGKFDV